MLRRATKPNSPDTKKVKTKLLYKERNIMGNNAKRNSVLINIWEAIARAGLWPKRKSCLHVKGTLGIWWLLCLNIKQYWENTF